jgi:putative endonuclease
MSRDEILALAIKTGKIRFDEQICADFDWKDFDDEKFTPLDIYIMKHYVYILKSEKDKLFYVGYTKDHVERIKLHNSGQVPSTRTRKPLTIVYYEVCLNQKDATHREKYLKSTWGKRYIKNRLKNYLTG